MNTELDIFFLFITPRMTSAIVSHTNTYALLKVATRGYSKTYVDRHGCWTNTTAKEIEEYMALLIYFGLVKLGGSTDKYWSIKTIYHSLLTRKILSQNQYKTISAFLRVDYPTNQTFGNKLWKVEEFLASSNERCTRLYQPSQKLPVDERMGKSNHWSGIRQRMKGNPTKWGLKLRVLAGSENEYAVDFNAYMGKEAAKETGCQGDGLGYDVVMTLMGPCLDQGIICI